MKIRQARGDLSLRQREAKHKMMFFGHVMRANGMEKDMMLACGEERWKRGRPRKRWMEEIHTMLGMSLAELRDVAEDREVWRKLSMKIDRTHRADSTR